MLAGQGERVLLGLMPPLTGVVGIYGEEIVRAAKIAVQEVNEAGGVLGRPLELVVEDDGSLPPSAVRAAEKLVNVHGCAAIIGNLLSNARIAVAYQVAEPRKVPYLNFSFYEGGIISRYFFHLAALPNQQIDRMIPYMKARFGPRMFFAGNNYEWPRGSIDAAKRALQAIGGTVVGEEYLPIGVAAQDVEDLLQRVDSAHPDVFVPYFAGLDQVELLTRFSTRGMKERMAVVMGHYDENMASHLPPEVREGYFSCNTYFMSVETAENEAFLARLAALPDVTGVWPQGNGIITNFSEGAYLCTKAFALAANRAGSIDSEAVVDALEKLHFRGPQGLVEIHPGTHHARVNTFLTQCTREGSFRVVENFGPLDPVIPERYRHMGTSASSTHDEGQRIAARIVDYMSEGVTLIDVQTGDVIYANPGAEKMFGVKRGELIGRNVSSLYGRGERSAAEVNHSINQALYRHGFWQGDIQYQSGDGVPFWCSATISAFTHAEFGEVWLAVNKDITLQKVAERALRESEERFRSLAATLEEKNALLEKEVADRLQTEEALHVQQEALVALSAPVIKVWDGVLALPVIGAVDGARALRMTEKLLEEIVKDGALVAILDLTGVELVDAETASHLLRIVRAANLLGSHCVVSGISPPTARMLVEFDAEVGELITFATLQDALRHALESSRRRKLRPGPRR